MRKLQFERKTTFRQHAAIIVVACAVIVTGIASAPAQAAPRDSLANARLCLHDGWKTLKTSDGRSFRNLGSCVVFAIFGGQFGSTTPSGGGE
jgi:hypothetical protein